MADKSIYLLTQNLEPVLYNSRDIFECMAELIRRNKNTDIRILCHDSRSSATNGHYLIQLAQKLPSYVQIRTTVTPIHRKFSESWLLIDGVGFMRIKIPARFEGYTDTDNRLDCRSMTETFMEMWEASQPDQNTRRLSL